MTQSIQIGMIGAKFIASIHAESIQRIPNAELLAVASANESSASEFASRHKLKHAFNDYAKMLEMDELDLVVIGLPNHLHCQAVLDCASAGKHVVLEKPMAPSLAECDRMIEACEKANVKLMYAEELCFAPKYVRLKQLVDEGAFGEVFLVKQSEKHDGPHAPWFWDVDKSGGGVMLDMGCHGIEFARWMLGKPAIRSVYCDLKTSVHGERTEGDDTSLLIIDFANGATAYIEEAWSKLGGMDDRAEIHGSQGVAYADLLRGNSISAYSNSGYGYAVEKAGATSGWSFAIYEEAWNYGFPQEMEHFIDCVRNDTPPEESGLDGRIVMETLHAAYASAGQGRRIDLPFPSTAARPHDLWKNGA